MRGEKEKLLSFYSSLIPYPVIPFVDLQAQDSTIKGEVDAAIADIL